MTSPVTPHFLTELLPPDTETNMPGVDPHKYSPLLMTKGHVCSGENIFSISQAGQLNIHMEKIVTPCFPPYAKSNSRRIQIVRALKEIDSNLQDLG